MSTVISEKDKSLIRDLGRQVAEIASNPVHDEKRDMWERLNSLERVRPLIHVQAIDWNIWEELIAPDQLESKDPFVRKQELALRKKIYCWQNFKDDRVVDDVVASKIYVEGDVFSTGYGVETDIEKPANPSGAHLYRPVIKSEEDIEKIKPDPHVTVNWEKTELLYQQLSGLYDGVLRVEKRGPDFFWFAPMDSFLAWRGIEQMYVDLVERPEWIHEVLERITIGAIKSIRQMEQRGVLSLGNGNTRLGSGGYGWTNELPQSDYDGEHVRITDLWARASTQIFTEGVSPEMHDEFAIQYEKRFLEMFGLSCYGCCEPLDNKMHVVRKIKNLRRVSMSPWVDVARASEAVGKDYVYTHKPNPSIVSMTEWSLDLARSKLRDAFEKTKENILEVNLQDLHTVQNQPHRLTEWSEMALQLSEEYA